MAGSFLIAACLFCSHHGPQPVFTPAPPPPPPPPAANGAIFQPQYGYAPLTSGQRAAQVGDVITIVLVERTQGTSTSTSATDRAGNIGLTPPTTGPLSLFAPTDASMGGNSTFAGHGQTGQSNSLVGEISVVVSEVLPNGNMRVRGEKLLHINRGNETIRVAGIVRPGDISADNRVASTRVADAQIDYVGRGEISRASRQGWLQRFFSILSPF
ncbi:MAG: flagellar basal body L-ring protein FlgH [Sphingomonadaceae bacterium]|nr:flagellar basal body L-ring protein FlgH [Sphingomonadaceae bacterium]